MQYDIMWCYELFFLILFYIQCSISYLQLLNIKANEECKVTKEKMENMWTQNWSIFVPLYALIKKSLYYIIFSLHSIHLKIVIRSEEV
jgi:hypothetical protein